MRCLTDQELLQVWNTSLDQPPGERTLTILSAFLVPAFEVTRQWPFSHQNYWLLRVYQQKFKSELECFTHCPHCQEAVEFSLAIESLYAPNTPEQELQGQNEEREITIGEYQFRFRLLTSEDLQFISWQGLAPECKREELLRRMIVHIRQNEALIELADLTPETLEAFVEQIAIRDPYIEFLLTLSCPGCEQAWESWLDINAFLWQAVESHIQCLLNEVHLLAQAYGWSEEKILAMNKHHRQMYLQKVSY